MDGLAVSFQDNEKHFMVLEALKEYAVVTTEAYYEDTGDQKLMGFKGQDMKLICWIINIYHLTAQHRQYQVGYRGCMNECSQRRHKKITGQGQLTYVLLGVHHPPKIPLW